MNLSKPSILPLTHVYSSAAEAWLSLVEDIVRAGERVTPRGRRTRELLASSRTFDMRYPVVNVRGRRLGYRFMCAEAAWILSGDDRVSSIAPFSKEISRFSDDGMHFFGAYGPKVVDQLPYVVKTLVDDRDSRQAVINIWRENPPRTKDVPCTLNLQFLIRNHELHAIANMRSSDAWLGWPYDVFNFTMIASAVALNHATEPGQARVPVKLGTLTLRAGSQHLYEDDLESAVRTLSYENRELEGVNEMRELDPFEFENAYDLIDELWAVARDIPGNTRVNSATLRDVRNLISERKGD